MNGENMLMLRYLEVPWYLRQTLVSSEFTSWFDILQVLFE